MRAALVLLLGYATILSGAAVAQEASLKETRCWAGDISFSAGAGINGGEGVAVCRAGTGWQQAAETDALITGCLLEGKLSSVGAVVGIRNNDSMLLRCDATGRWSTLESSPGG